jgi:hypothetical protein
VSVGDHHPEDTQDDGRQHIALRHPAYAARHTNWADSMEGNAVANPCQATEPAEKAPSIDPTVVCSAEADVKLTAGGSNFTLRSRDGNVCASGHARRSGLLWCGRSSGCHVVWKYSIRCSSRPDNLPIQNRAHNAGAAPPAPEALPIPIRPANLLEADRSLVLLPRPDPFGRPKRCGLASAAYGHAKVRAILSQEPGK